MLNDLDECWGIQILNPYNPTLGIHFNFKILKVNMCIK
jgi:hypothetical protein